MQKTLKQFLFGTGFRKRRQSRDPLDHVLFQWPTGDPYLVRHLLQSVAILGQTGSGKSSGSGLLFARTVVGLKNSGGLILASKPEDRAFWTQRFEEAGRRDDLIIFRPDHPAHCNFLDYELQCGGDSRSLTQFLAVTGEALGEGGREGEQFWKQSQERMIYNAVEAVRQGAARITVPNIQQFISSASYSDAQSTSDSFKNGFHYQTMLAANDKEKTPIERHDFQLLCDYWVNEFVHMDDKPRSSILAGVMNILHTYNTGIVREMVSTTSTITPAVMGQGKWVLVDFPLDVYGASGKIIMHGWKFLTQKYILRRHARPGDSVIIIHADEAQEMVSSFDGAFLAKCRSHKGAMIYLTQSIHSYFGEMKTPKAKALMTNFATKIFHTVGDSDTAEFGASLLGQRREVFINVTPKSDLSLGEEMFGAGGGSCSLSETYQPILQSRVFLSGLRCGGPPDFCVDGIVIKSGKAFSTGENWQLVTFSQR